MKKGFDYSSPMYYYIGSHTESLKYDGKNNLNGVMAAMRTIVNDLLDQAVQKSFVNKNDPVFVKYYNDTHTGTLRHVSSSIVKDLTKFKSDLYKIKGDNTYEKRVIEDFTTFLLDNSSITDINVAISSHFATDLADIIKDTMSKEYKKTPKIDKVFKRDNKKVLNDTMRKLIKRALTKYLTNSKAESSQKEIVKIMQEMDTLINNYLNQQRVVFSASDQSANTLRNKIEKTNLYGERISAIANTGNVFELATPALMTESLQGTQISVNNNGQVDNWDISAVSESTSKHGNTRDFILKFTQIVEEGQEKIEKNAGVTVKFTNDSFAKNLSLSQQDVATYMGVHDNFLRMLISMKALATFAVQEEGSEPVLDSKNKAVNINFTRNETPMSGNSKIGQLIEWQKTISILGLIKALVGGDFLQKNLLVDPPVWLSTANNDYWMYDILLGIKTICNSSNLSRIMKINYIDWESLPFFSSFTEENLKYLYVAKKAIKKDGGNRRWEIINNDVDPTYTWVLTNNNIKKKMYEMTSGINVASIQDVINKHARFHFSISNIVNTGTNIK